MKKAVSLALTAFLVIGILSAVPKVARSPQLQSQLVVDDYTLALWHLNEGEGQVVHDESVHHNDGTLGETSNVEDVDPSWVGGFTGESGDYALSFDDWYDYVSIPDNPDGSLDVQLLDQFTIEFWTNLRQISRSDRGDGTHWNRFLEKGYIAYGPPDICGYGIYQCLGYNSFSAWVQDYGTENWQIGCSPTPPLNTWVLISLVYDGNYARIYFNNVMQSEREVGWINFTDTAAPLTLGKWPGEDWPWADSIDGIIDEVRLSSIARDRVPITAVYVDPPEIAARPFENFTVNISVANVTELYGWQTRLKWDPQLLEIIDVTEGDFLKSGGSTYCEVEINQVEGCLSMNNSPSVDSIGHFLAVNGSGTLANLTFRSTKLGECVLDLYNTRLVSSLVVPVPPYLGDADGDLKVSIVDVGYISRSWGASLGDPRYDPDADFNKDGIVDLIDLLYVALNFQKDYHVQEFGRQPVEASHEAQDGHVEIRPVIEISVSDRSVNVGESFNISIGITDAVDFYSVQYRISWDPELLRVADFFEGNMLPSLGKSVFTYTVYEEKGYAHIASSLIGPVEVPELSNGTLSTVEFYAAKAGSSLLNVSDTPYNEKGVTVTIGEGAATQSVANLKQSSHIVENSDPPTTWTVGQGQQFSTIQEAIDAANPGDKIHVYSGTYTEHVTINKFNITLIGESKDTTVIKAPTQQQGTAAIKVLANDSKIMEFTIQDSYKGIDVFEYNGSIIRDNIIKNNFVGIDLIGYTNTFAAQNTLLWNNITGNSGIGAFFWITEKDAIRANNITDNYEGIQINTNFRDSVICFNNIINNAIQVYPLPPPGNTQWYITLDGNNKGNYWNPNPNPNPDPYPLQSLWAPIEGDINLDGRVNILDISPAAAAFGSSWSHPRWIPYADVEKNGHINIIDIARIALHYQQVDP